VDQQHGFVGIAVKLADDLLNEDMDEALLGTGIGRRCVPSRRQVVGKLQQKRAVDLRLFR
jgi:hypothetical protein